MFKTTALNSVANEYVDKDVGTSTPGTRLEEADRNITQDELVALVERSLQVLDATGVKRIQAARAAFLNGVAAQSMVDTGGVNTKVLTPISGASGYVFGESYAQLTGAAFMFKNDTTNTGATTVNVGQTAGTLLGVKDLTQAGGVAFVGGELIAGSYNLIIYDLANDRFEIVTIESFTVPRNHIDGLIMSNGTDTEHDIDIGIGEAADFTNAYLMKLTAAMTKQIDVAWAVGDNEGGMFTGSVAVDTWYHVYMIRKDSDGSIDFGFDTSLTASNAPAGYSNYSYIGSVFTNGSSNIIGFIQDGDDFWWLDSVLDVAADATLTSTQKLYTLSVPPVPCKIILTGGGEDADAFSIYIQDKAMTDFSPAGRVGAAKFGQVLGRSDLTTDTTAGASTFRVRSTDSQVAVRANAAIATFSIMTHGWVDRRGKDAQL